MENWTELAACHGMDTNIWFPIGTPGAPLYELAAERAREICYGCPVQMECGLYALENGVEFGIFGGMDEHERAELLRALPRVPAA